MSSAFAAGQKVTAGGLADIASDWVSYTATLSNLTIGTGSVQTQYIKDGKWIDLAVLINWGSTTSASGIIAVSPPITPTSDGMRYTGTALINRNSGNFRPGQTWMYAAASTMQIGCYSINATVGDIVSLSAGGVTMVSGGWITANIRYRCD